MSNPPEQRGFSRLKILRGMILWNVRGALDAVYSTITTGAYATGYALHLGASSAFIGLLSAAPAWGNMLQVFSPLLIERLRRRKVLCLVAYGISYAIWIPIAVLPFFIDASYLPWALVAFITASGISSAMAAPANSSWLTDLVPADIRGRFIGRQMSITATVGLVMSLVAGGYLDSFSQEDQQTGFTSLFIIAVIFGIAAIAVWGRIPEPPKHRGSGESARKLLALPFRHAKFRTFMLLISVRGLLANIVAPFFAVYMLQTLQISYAEIAIFAALQTLARIIMNPLWGYLGDKFGHRPVLILCSAGLALFPLWWVFATVDNYMVVVPLTQVWGGMMSAGVPTSRFNLMAKTAPEENRSIYIGCYFAIFNMACALGAITGGAAATLCAQLDSLSVLGYSISNLQYLFIGGFFLRLVSVALLTYVHEDSAISARVVLNQVGGSPVSTIWHLVRMGRSSDPMNKARVVREIGETGSPLVVEELISLLDDSDRDVRKEAAKSLGRIGDERAVEPLLEKVSDPSSDIATEAIEALGCIPSLLSLNILVTLLDEENPEVRRSAVLALGRVNDPRSESALEQLLEVESDHTVIMATTEVLSRMGNERILPRLQAMLRDSTPGIERKMLTQSIGHVLGEPDQVYRMLQGDMMSQDRQIARVFSTARRRLLNWDLNEATDPSFYENHLDEALHCYEHQAYNDAILHCNLMVEQINERATIQQQGIDTLEDNGHMVEAILVDDDLFFNCKFIHDLHDEINQRTLMQEEFFLGVVVFNKILEDVKRLAS